MSHRTHLRFTAAHRRAAAWLCCAASVLSAVSVPAAADEAVAPLRFADFHRRPIGPRGLEPGPRLLALEGQRVALAGYVAHGGERLAQTAVLAPLPVALGDEDESLADDLPAAVAYLHWTDPRLDAALADCAGLLRVTGRLELGARAEADGRRSYVRVQAEDVQCARVR